MALTQVSTGGIKDGQVHTADLADAQITAGKLHADALDRTYTLGASGTNYYTFQGEGLNGTVNNPTLYLTRGKTYRFVNGNSSGAHPFRIQSVAGVGGTEYNTGVTNNAGAGGSTIIFEVPHDTTIDVLYYQCTSHPAMNGIFYVTGTLADGIVTTAKLADDAVTDAKIANSINTAIAANTAKTSNATHTGDVTGSTSLTIAADAVTTAKIANDAVTADKLANSINTAIAANTAKDLTALSASNLTSGTVPDARFPATLPAVSGANLTGISSAGVNKNLIINGAMQVCQRYNLASMNNISGSTHTYHTDRFKGYNGNGGILGLEWQTNHPEGFSKSLRIKAVGADTSINGDTFISHVIEDINFQHLNYGLSTAQTCTLSFWIKSNMTGTFSVGLMNDTQWTRGFVAEYTISAANTWERKTISVPGDTSGTWNSGGLRVHWALATKSASQTSTLGSWQATTPSTTKYGSTNQSNFMASTANYMNLTGVQFELGSTATGFEHKFYADELTLCERYYVKDSHGGIRNAINNNSDRIPIHHFRTQMRASPSVSGSSFTEFSAGTSRSISSYNSVYSAGGGYAQLSSSPSNGVYVWVTLDAEL